MPKNMSKTSDLMGAIVDKGAADQWLRGVAEIVPARSSRKGKISAAFNKHCFRPPAGTSLRPAEVVALRGFQTLVKTCAANNVSMRLNTRHPEGLELSFDPSRQFVDSDIFGRGYEEALPALLEGVRLRHRPTTGSLQNML